MMNKRCLHCYKVLDKSVEGDFHDHCNKEFFGTKKAPLLSYSLNDMVDLAKNVIERSIAVTGVQPKLSLSLIKEVMNNAPTTRLTVVGALGGNYIFKPPSEHYPEMPQNEHLTMRLAETFGIRTVPSSLIRLQSGEQSYITKRIDRLLNGEKIHMLDMFQITEANDKYKSSMEKVGKALDEYSNNTLLDKLYLFELTIFCFLTGNNDMHLKNFSMINSNGDWILSPAYDLLNVAIVNSKDEEELALTLEGKKKKLEREHFERFGKGLDLTDRQIESAFNRFIENKSIAKQWINDSFLSAEFKLKYWALMSERYLKIER